MREGTRTGESVGGGGRESGRQDRATTLAREEGEADWRTGMEDGKNVGRGWVPLHLLGGATLAKHPPVGALILKHANTS